MADKDIYVDPWLEYKTIASKLKKRFLKRPNYSEASKQFAQLASRLKDEEVWSYAGYTKLAQARTEHVQGNTFGESVSLAEAGRLYLHAEAEKHELHLPSYKNDLTSAIHCFGHAIRVQLEQGNIELATNLCMELGMGIYGLHRPYEAVQYFQRAARLSDDKSIEGTKVITSASTGAHLLLHILAQKWAITCLVEGADYPAALEVVCELNAYVREKVIEGGIESETVPSVGPSNSSMDPSAYLCDVLRDCEILAILLIIRLNMQAKHLKEEQKQILERYTNVGLPSEIGRDMERSFLMEDEFLYLQSFVLAIKEKDYRFADSNLTQLWPKLKVYMQELAMRTLLYFWENEGSGLG